MSDLDHARKGIEEIIKNKPEGEQFTAVAGLKNKYPSLEERELKRIYLELRENTPSEPPASSASSVTSEKRLATLENLIELVQTEDGLKFWFSDGLKDTITAEDCLISPPKEVSLFKLPTEKALSWLEKDDDEKLFNDLCAFTYEHVELPDDRGYLIDAAHSMHTWLIEKANYSPIERALGPHGTGKSTLREVKGAVAKRAINTVCLTGPALFRVNELYKPSLLVDEVTLFGLSGNKDLKDMLNSRFGRGLQVVRVNKDKQGLASIECFEVFGPTLLAGTENLPDTVKSRCITFVMERNSRKVRRTLDKERAAELRDRLAAFRARHLETVLETPEPIVRNGRLDDILYPLHQIILLVKPLAEQEFIEFSKDIERDRNEEDALTLDAQVVAALRGVQREVVGGKIAVGLVADKLNEGRPDRERFTERTVGNILTRLGFKTTRTSTGHGARFFDNRRLERLERRYGLDQQSDDTEATEDNDDTDVAERVSDSVIDPTTGKQLPVQEEF